MSETPNEVTWKDAFLFPVQSREALKDVAVGGLLILLLWPIGWILNLGNRLEVVARLAKNEQPIFRGFKPWAHTFLRGCISATTIFVYLSPCILFAGLASLALNSEPGAILPYAFAALSALAFVLGLFTLPGCMTIYAVEGDPAILTRPIAAFKQGWTFRKTYLRAWAIALAAMALSFLGLLFAGVGFLFTSVWAWHVVGYVFTITLVCGAQNSGAPAGPAVEGQDASRFNLTK